MDTTSHQVTCTQCQRTFTPRFSFQTAVINGETKYYCSQTCRNPVIARPTSVKCSHCNRMFIPIQAYQIKTNGQNRSYYCSQHCITQATTSVTAKSMQKRLAIINQKGGTGKTTTAVNIASGLANRGEKVLLLDLDPQGSVGASLGVKGNSNAYEMFIKGINPLEYAVPIRDNLDILTSDQSLSKAEIFLARSADNRRTNILSRVLHDLEEYSWIIVDCAPAFSLLNQNILNFAKNVIVPVSCEYLSLVGLQQAMKTIEHVSMSSQSNVQLRAILPTFYDVRNNVSNESLKYLKERFGKLTLPPIRINVKIQEAVGKRKTIFEHAPDSHGARDYTRVVEWLINSKVIEEHLLNHVSHN